MIQIFVDTSIWGHWFDWQAGADFDRTCRVTNRVFWVLWGDVNGEYSYKGSYSFQSIWWTFYIWRQDILEPGWLNQYRDLILRYAFYDTLPRKEEYDVDTFGISAGSWGWLLLDWRRRFYQTSKPDSGALQCLCVSAGEWNLHASHRISACSSREPCLGWRQHEHVDLLRFCTDAFHFLR